MMQTMTRIVLGIVIAASTLGHCEAQLTASVNEDHFLVLEASSLELLAIEFHSPSGSLIPSEISAPFQGVLVQDDSLALYYNLGSPFVLDGSITLNTQWDPTKRNDIQFQYGTPSTDQGLQPILGHQVFASAVSDAPVVVLEPGFSSEGDATEQSPTPEAGDEGIAFTASAVDPSETPRITASRTHGGLQLHSDTNLSISKLSVRSENGLLSNGGQSDLFELITMESKFEVQYSNPVPIFVQGDFFLPIVMRNDQLGDLSVDLLTTAGETLSAEVRAVPEPDLGISLVMLNFLVISRLLRCRRRL